MKTNLPLLSARVSLLISLILFIFSCKKTDSSPEDPDTPETVYVVNLKDGYLQAHNATSGDNKWDLKLGDLTGGITVADGTVYVAGRNKLVAVDAATGTKRWDKTLDATDPYSDNRLIPTVVNGIIYVSVVGFESKLHALNALTGEPKWDFATGIGSISSPTVSKGIVYIGAASRLIAIDASTGTKKWQVDSLRDTPTNPAIVDGVVYTNYFGRLYAYDELTGIQKWAAPSGYPVQGSATVSNGLIYVKAIKFGSGDTSGIHIFHAKTGKRVSSFYFDFAGNSSPSVANGFVYVGSGNISIDDATQVYAFDASSTQIYPKWSQGVKNLTSVSSVVAAGTVFMPTCAMDALTGDIRWQLNVNSYDNYSSVCVVTKKGVVYHPSESGDKQ